MQAYKRPSQSAEAYQKSLRLEPDDAGTHFNLGTTYEAMGELKKAFHVSVHTLLIHVHVQLCVLEHANGIWPEMPTPATHFNRKGRLTQRLGR